MRTTIVEATHSLEGEGACNHGKFLVGAFDKEWASLSHVPPMVQPICMLDLTGWTLNHYLVLDLETGEGAIFKPTGYAKYDLDQKHRIWVCPLFPAFLTWLYEQHPFRLEDLPAVVELPDAPFDFAIDRSKGKSIPEPCPFCGVTPCVQPQSTFQGAEWGMVACWNAACSAKPRVYVYADNKDGDSTYQEQAIERWNRRAIHKETEKEK